MDIPVMPHPGTDTQASPYQSRQTKETTNNLKQMNMKKKNSIKRAQSQARLSFAERKNFRPMAKILTLLVLLMTAVSGAWAEEETLLTTITPTGDGTYSETTAGAVTVTPAGSFFYSGSYYGWRWDYYGSLTVTANEGYTITRCVFIQQGNNQSVTISEAPFALNFEEWLCYENSSMDGVTSIEVYGTAPAAPAANPEYINLTPNTDGTVWTLAEMPDFDVELEVEYYEQVEGVVANQDPDKTSDYWCTYYNPTTNVKVSTAGVSIYKAALSGETLALSKVDGNVIKGGQAVVLKSTVGGELEMEETPDDATGDYTGNELKGTTEAINGNGNIYVLNYTQENGVGFYQLSANGTLGANKAYLEYNGSNARAFFSFGFDDETSGIENTSRTDDTNRGEVYDLQGRQVKQPARGLYIKSGKKVVIK